MGRKLQLILFLSLALNLLFVGILVGYGFRGCGREKRHGRLPPEILEKVSPEQQKKFQDALFQIHKKGREVRRDIRQERKNSMDILTAPQFDAEAYRKSMNELHEMQGVLKGQLTDTVIQLASQLNQEDRKALAAFLARGPKGEGRGDRWRGPGRDRGPGGPPREFRDRRGPPPPPPPPESDEMGPPDF